MESQIKYLNVRYMPHWNLCNYTCPYCSTGKITSTNKRDLLFDEETYETIISNLLKTPYQLRLRLGIAGEIFLSKYLIKSASELSWHSKVDALNLISNMSFAVNEYDKIFSSFNLKKIGLVVSYHPTEVKNLQKFLDTAKHLSEMMDLSVCMVAYPLSIEHICEVKLKLDQAGIRSFIHGFIGEFNGKTYPMDYSAEEKKKIKGISSSRVDYEFFIEAVKPGLCHAGHNYIFVNAKGTAIRCGNYAGSPKLIGDLSKSSDLMLFDGPKPCPYSTCLCSTDYVNTVVFHKYYTHPTKNQAIYEFRFDDVDEWGVDFGQD